MTLGQVLLTDKDKSGFSTWVLCYVTISLKMSHAQKLCKLAVFDFDGTLVRVKSTAPFPKDANDWVFFCDKQIIVDRWKEALAEQFTICIRSDQTKKFKGVMITNVLTELAIACNIQLCDIIQCISWDKSTHKPSTTIFNNWLDQNGLEIDLANSFYVGDAAGRKGDWSDVDREFAKNMQLPFFTPEQYFTPCTQSILQPDVKMSSNAQLAVLAVEGVLYVMCGLPASGKSTFCSQQASSLFVIHGDDHKTFAKMKKVCLENKSIHGFQSVVIDACNTTAAKRQEWIVFGKEQGYEVVCIWVDTPVQQCLVQNKVRRDAGFPGVPTIAIHTANKRFEPPTTDECEVIRLTR